MQLLYIWVEDFRCFKNNEFNFSSKYKFKYDAEENIMEVRVSEYDTLSLLNDGKNVISDITVIVGENGAGKTSLADLLFSDIDLSMNEGKRIYILGDEEKIYVYCSGNWKNINGIRLKLDYLSDDEKDEIRFVMNVKSDVVCLDRLNYQEEILINKYGTLDLWRNKDIDAIYDSNTFSYQSILRNEKKDMNSMDISLGNIYLTNKEEYFKEEFKGQISFIIDQRRIFETNIGFNLPNKISMEIYIEKFKIPLDEKNIINNFLNKLISTIRTKKISIKYIFKLMLSIYMMDILLEDNLILKKGKEANNERKKLKSNKIEYINRMEKVFSDFGFTGIY